MLKSLLLISAALSLGVSAQDQSGQSSSGLPDLSAIPKDCLLGKCASLATVLPQCGSLNAACLQALCEKKEDLRTCLECAKMTDLLAQFDQQCGKNATGSASGSASASGASSTSGAPANSTSASPDVQSEDKKSGTGALAVSVGAVAAGAAVAAWF